METIEEDLHSQHMDDLMDSGRKSSASSQKALSGKKSIRDSSLSDGSSEGRGSIKSKKKQSGFKKWLKEKFASCFGTTNHTTDLSDGFSSNSPSYPNKGGKVNWQHAWERVIDETFEANDQA